MLSAFLAPLTFGWTHDSSPEAVESSEGSQLDHKQASESSIMTHDTRVDEGECFSPVDRVDNEEDAEHAELASEKHEKDDTIEEQEIETSAAVAVGVDTVHPVEQDRTGGADAKKEPRPKGAKIIPTAAANPLEASGKDDLKEAVPNEGAGVDEPGAWMSLDAKLRLVRRTRAYGRHGEAERLATAFVEMDACANHGFSAARIQMAPANSEESIEPRYRAKRPTPLTLVDFDATTTVCANSEEPNEPRYRAKSPTPLTLAELDETTTAAAESTPREVEPQASPMDDLLCKVRRLKAYGAAEEVPSMHAELVLNVLDVKAGLVLKCFGRDSSPADSLLRCRRLANTFAPACQQTEDLNMTWQNLCDPSTVWKQEWNRETTSFQGYLKDSNSKEACYQDLRLACPQRGGA